MVKLTESRESITLISEGMVSNGPKQAVLSLRSLRRTHYSLVLLTAFVLAGFCFHLSSASSCLPCDPHSCQSVHRNCAGGLTTDACECCKVCAKVVNETCGGKYGLAGKCDEGLECLPSVEVGESITGHEEGICQGTYTQFPLSTFNRLCMYKRRLLSVDPLSHFICRKDVITMYGM